MKVLVLSDSHGDRASVERVVKLEEPDLTLHLGDYGRDLKEGLSVRGNCDGLSSLPLKRKISLEGLEVLMVHGHREGVKNGLHGLYYLALEEEVDLVLFGHTHHRENLVKDGIRFLNPGSISRPNYGDRASYLLLMVEGKSIEITFKEV